MIRKPDEILNIEEILREEYFVNITKSSPKRHEIRGDMIKLGKSLRLQTFYHKGLVCCKCGLPAKFFVKEKAIPNEAWHVNLYGVNKEGQEVLFTHDHIVPKSRGGKNNLENTQTMCCYCNWDKGNKLESEL